VAGHAAAAIGCAGAATSKNLAQDPTANPWPQTEFGPQCPSVMVAQIFPLRHTAERMRSSPVSTRCGEPACSALLGAVVHSIGRFHSCLVKPLRGLPVRAITPRVGQVPIVGVGDTSVH